MEKIPNFSAGNGTPATQFTACHFTDCYVMF